MLLLYPRKIEETKLIVRDVSTITLWAGLLFLIPMIVGLIYGEASWPVYLLFTLLVSGTSYLITRCFKEEEKPFTRLTIVTIAATWVICCAIASLPFMTLGGMGILDGLFESVSSASTAGLTTIYGVDSVPHSVLFWRALVAWFGGIGITSIAFYGIMQSESMSRIILGEGFDRLKPNLVNSAKEILKIYSFWTVLGIALLILIGTPVFDSFNMSMNAVSTTGVDVHQEGWGYYQRTMPETFGIMSAVVAMLMVVGAVSFVAHYRVVKNRRLRLYLKDSETLSYMVILIVGVLLVSSYLAANGQAPGPMAYEALSVSTTGGFETTPYMTAGAADFVMAILIILALIGGCSNSAAGGIKVKRVYLLFKYVYWKVGRQIAPKGAVSHLKYEGRIVSMSDVTDAATYLFIYAAAIILVTGLMAAYEYDALNSALTVTSAQGGGGVSAIPGWELAAPVKLALIGTMLFGRLEFIPLFALILYVFRRR